MMKNIMKLRPFTFFIFGLALGAAIFCVPSVFAGDSGFALLPAFFGSWYLAATPYLVMFALVFGALALGYRLFKKSFPFFLTDGAWMLAGLYLSLTVFFYFVGVATKGALLMI